MLRTIQAVAVLVAFIPAVALGQGKVTSADKVKADVKAEKSSGATRAVTVKLDIQKGWHIYANPVGNELLEDGATKLTFLADGKAVEAKVEYPKGKAVTVGPDRYNVYEESVTIKASVPAGAAKVRIKVQACDDKNCLLPGSITLDVP
jgi:DsbC/DsbD-like thiol-disulfide interchange protein